MKYAAIHTYNNVPDLIATNRPSHRAYITTLLDKNQLVVAGPFTDDSGALIVYEADTVEAVEAMIKADPFFACGVFKSWVIKPWKTIFGNPALLPPNG
jgi:uncharacterized protein